MQNGSGVFRRKVGFTIATNNLVHDTELSLKAKGLYLLIMSYITLEGLQITKTFLLNRCTEKEKAFNNAWSELKEAGYLKVYCTPHKGSWLVEYELLDEKTEGAHTFYMTADGSLSQTNLTRKNKSDSSSTQENDTLKSNRKERTPQKGGYAQNQSSADQRYPQNGMNANGGNKIILNNKTNRSLNPSIYQENIEEDGEMDRERVKNEIRNVMQENHKIPEEYLSSPRHMAEAVKQLTDWGYLHQGHYENELEQAAYCLLVDSLTELLCQEKQAQSKVSSWAVLEKINRLLPSDNDISLWIELTMSDYITAARERTIKNHKGYMKSCLWNSLGSFQARFHAEFERQFGV